MQDSNIPLTVPEVLREAGFVPRKKGTKRPAPVPESWFADVGLPVPDDPGQCNACQLTGREGFAWSPELDARVATHGAELRGHGALVLVDCDAERLVDGSPGIDGMRRLADLVTEGGGILDLSGAVRVRTPGNGDHGPGVHLWWRADPGYPVQYGTLNRCKLVEFLHRGTAPGSPGYPVQYVPRKLAVIRDAWPSWPGRHGSSRHRLAAAAAARSTTAWPVSLTACSRLTTASGTGFSTGRPPGWGRWSRAAGWTRARPGGSCQMPPQRSACGQQRHATRSRPACRREAHGDRRAR